MQPKGVFMTNATMPQKDDAPKAPIIAGSEPPKKEAPAKPASVQEDKNTGNK
jgi:hypothetical protein